MASDTPIRIESSPLCFEREDLALLDEPTRDKLVQLAKVLNRYNTVVEAAQVFGASISSTSPTTQAQIKEWLDQIDELAVLFKNEHQAVALSSYLPGANRNFLTRFQWIECAAASWR